MTTKITAAGYIVSNNQAIWGAGKTTEDAWLDFKRGMSLAYVNLDDDQDPNSTKTDAFELHPATAALLQAVEECGGAIAWGVVDGVCCTVAEEDAHQDEGV
jgi:hypothetical protein